LLGPNGKPQPRTQAAAALSDSFKEVIVGSIDMMRKRFLSPRADKTLSRRIESIKRQKIVGKKVVSLSDYRDLQKKTDIRTILVVDDDEIMRNAMKRILENEGYKVILAIDGLELSKILETSRLDMILLDVNLPWVDGYELCRLIKEHRLLKEVPLVLVSARKSKSDIQAGFDAGCNDYVTKPFDIDYITGIINKMLLKSS
jgi:two-component system aerobic respiration control protein ArcA